MEMTQKITAGDSYSMTVATPDYPASSGWALTYVLQPRGFTATPITLVGVASGADHIVAINAVDSALYTPGEYDAFGFVTKGSERHTVITERITIDPNPTQAADRRSWLEKTITILEASIAGIASAEYQTMTILGKSLGRMSMAEKLQARDKLKIELQQEIRSKNKITAYGRMIQCGFVLPVSHIEATPQPTQSTFTP